MYSGCIPLEALHQEEGNQYYVYTTDEKKTILGTEVIARRVDVTVESICSSERSECQSEHYPILVKTDF